MPNILSLDTSSDTCSVALSLNGQQFSESLVAPRQHAQLILPMVKSVLSQAGASTKDVDVVAFGCGPGSFTGLRIAAGIAQGLAFGADCKVLAVSNLRAQALQRHRLTQANKILVAIDARMDEVYWAAFDVFSEDEVLQLQCLSGEHVSAPENIAVDSLLDSQLPEAMNLPAVAHGSWQGCGSGFGFVERFPDAWRNVLQSIDVEARPDAKDILELALADLLRGVEPCSPEDAAPTYIRDKVTWKKLPGRE